MRHILSTESVDLLAQVASAKVLVAFDFDGTLAPIVAERDDAVMRPRTKRLLAAVSRGYPCAVISGRGQRDVAARLAGTNVKYVVGNHGLEPGADLEKFEAQVAIFRPQLEKALGRLEGVDLEDKRYSVAVHYRRSRRRLEARAAILAAVAGFKVPMRLVPGKLVVNVVPPGAPNKGEALLALRAVEGADTALYVGDDVTDEDVFALDQPGRLLGIRVGASKASSSSFFVRDQREMDRLLQALVTFAKNRKTQ